jgi:iron complex outermembrane receptor protein
MPNSDWLINGGIGVLDTSVDELREIAGTAVGVVEGNVLPFSPEIQANFGLSYRARVGDGFTLMPRADLVHQGETYFDANNTVEIAQIDPYTVINASLVLAPTDERWRLTAGVSNLTDELYATGGNSSLTTGSGYAEIAYARPREFFVHFSVGF